MDPYNRLRSSDHYVRKTKCKFTVIIQCCDPPVPMGYYNTDSEKQARLVFEALKKEEIEKLGGGEFSITLYQHDLPVEQREIKYYRINDEDSDYDHPYVYGLYYNNSKTLEEFTYMDMYEAMRESPA